MAFIIIYSINSYDCIFSNNGNEAFKFISGVIIISIILSQISGMRERYIKNNDS